MKKILKAIVLSLMVLSLVVVGNAATSKAASNKANDVYKKFVDQLKSDKQYKDGIYTATMKAGKGEDILLVTDFTYKWRGNKACNAKVYQYVNGKVTYIGKFESDGTARPLAKSGKYLYVNTLHSTEKVLISNGKATSVEIDGLYLYKKYVKQNEYKIVNNKKTMTSSKKINCNEAEKKHTKDFSAKGINFKKVQ